MKADGVPDDVRAEFEQRLDAYIEDWTKQVASSLSEAVYVEITDPHLAAIRRSGVGGRVEKGDRIHVRGDVAHTLIRAGAARLVVTT